MYPNITLQIKNHKPVIVFYPNENESRVITENEENLSEIMIDLAKKLDLENEIASQINDRTIIVENLLQLARQSDESRFNSLIELDIDNTEFEIPKHLDKFLESTKGEKDNYNDLIEASNQVKKELERNQNSDIFAAAMDLIYNVLIAKTIVAAEHLGIGEIKLDDEYENARLFEKMARELDKMGLVLEKK